MKHKQLWLTAAVMTMLGTNMSFAAVQIGDNSIAEGDQPMSRSEYAKMIYELAEKLTTSNN